jgi:hypothetical protein
MEEPPLTIELVPRTVHYRNLRKALPKKAWDKIRRYVYKKADYECEICGGTGSQHPVECHEIWEYNDESQLQELSDFKALCPACHNVKHIGLATKRGTHDEAIQHLCEVNDWSAEQARRYEQEQFTVWQERSQHDWKQDFSLLREEPYNNLLEGINIDLRREGGG